MVTFTLDGGYSLRSLEEGDVTELHAVELGYWLAADTQGRGVMTAAASTLVDHAFSVLGLNRVEIRVAVGNARSRAIPERLGFKAEGTLREAERVGDRYHDVVVYAMLAHDWR